MFSLKSKKRIGQGEKFNPATYGREILVMDFIDDSFENGRAFRLFNLNDLLRVLRKKYYDYLINLFPLSVKLSKSFSCRPPDTTIKTYKTNIPKNRKYSTKDKFLFVTCKMVIAATIDKMVNPLNPSLKNLSRFL